MSLIKILPAVATCKSLNGLNIVWFKHIMNQRRTARIASPLILQSHYNIQPILVCVLLYCTMPGFAQSIYLSETFAYCVYLSFNWPPISKYLSKAFLSIPLCFPYQSPNSFLNSLVICPPHHTRQPLAPRPQAIKYITAKPVKLSALCLRISNFSSPSPSLPCLLR